MRIRTLSVSNTDSERELKIQFGRGSEHGGNFFSILVGENGTRKSQSLRAIVDLGYSSITRVRQSGLSVVGRLGQLTYWSNRNSEQKVLPSKIIAVSGVATDRFPSRITGRIRKRGVNDTYRYIGPRTENNLVSRAQSLIEIVRTLLTHHDRVPSRHEQLKAAFELIPISKGCLFEFERINSDWKKRWDVDSLLEILQRTEPQKAEKFKTADSWLREQCLTMLNGKNPIVLALNLDNIESQGISHSAAPETLAFALECGAISLSDPYSLTESGKRLALSEFSSGQWQLLSSLLFVALAAENDTLILIDEPENSLHPQWQREYLVLLERAISSCSGVHVIVATHSPLVASSLPPGRAEVLRLSRGRTGNVNAKEMKAGAFGWTADDILETVFGLPSTRSQLFANEMARALHLFAKGNRKNAELISRVRELAEFAKLLPEGDAARSVIATLKSVVLVDDKTPPNA
jgi:ABC-type Mn2+/Zn2+ transport system ATPase subunit